LLCADEGDVMEGMTKGHATQNMMTQCMNCTHHLKPICNSWRSLASMQAEREAQRRCCIQSTCLETALVERGSVSLQCFAPTLRPLWLRDSALFAAVSLYLRPPWLRIRCGRKPGTVLTRPPWLSDLLLPSLILVDAQR